ncbi:alpha/beta fold hydrolase [Roseateles chitosanitabidus]|uniref:alpha/beta fold hydrolase n=1 Tax=Roseateles chitosanitabidus TaxID=65048 RepID=UPI0008313AA1|nr:alpha/beta hydrolase [Roseateles chitosanitabidus]
MSHPVARLSAALLALTLASASVAAEPGFPPFPADFSVRDIDTGELSTHVRIGGSGEAVVLLHGFGETGDMWAPLAAELARHHRVIVPDLRGMGLSSRPAGGYDKLTQARDLARLLDALGIRQVALVTHDIGNMVGYAFAASHPARVSRFALIDAPLPGIGPWDEIARRHAVWHWSFWGADAERLVAGRERIYLDRFWNELAAPGNRYPEAAREHYAELYARPGAMHAAFEQFKAFDQDVIDNRALQARGRLTMPVLAVGGGRSYGPRMAEIMREVADDVIGVVIPGSGHWVLEERPAEVIPAVRDFLDAPPSR